MDVPLPVRVARTVAWIEAAVLIGYALLLLVMAGRGDRLSVANAALLAVLLAAWGCGLLTAGRALIARRRWSRSPILLSQLFGLVIGVPVAQGGALVAGGLIAIGAAAGLAAVMAPQVTEWVSVAGGEPSE